MLTITILMFNRLRQPAIVWLVVPMAVTGMVLGLLATGLPFTFTALLGLLSLSGMLIKNAIVLVGEFDRQRADGVDDHTAVVMGAVSRLRPVILAAGTTILGMTPLLPDAFFASMSVTIMGGLAVASMLTLIVVPALYAQPRRHLTGHVADPPAAQRGHDPACLGIDHREVGTQAGAQFATVGEAQHPRRTVRDEMPRGGEIADALIHQGKGRADHGGRVIVRRERIDEPLGHHLARAGIAIVRAAAHDVGRPHHHRVTLCAGGAGGVRRFGKFRDPGTAIMGHDAISAVASS